MATEIQSIDTRGLEQFFYSFVLLLNIIRIKVQKYKNLSVSPRSLTRFKLTVN